MEKENKLQRVICVLNPDDVYQITELTDSENKPYYITPYEIKQLKEQGIAFPQNINEGTILSLSPDLKSYYEQTQEKEVDIIHHRILEIQNFVSLLGAKEFDITSSSKEEYSKIVGVDVGVGASVGMGNVASVSGQVDTNVKKNNQNKNEEKLSVSAEWEGNFTKEGYDRAVEIAQESGIINLPVIRYLLDQRNPKHPNPIGRQTYSVDLLTDLAKNMEVATKLQADIKILSTHVHAHANVDVNREERLASHKAFEFVATFGHVKPSGREIIDVEPINAKALLGSLEERRILTEKQPLGNVTSADIESFKESEVAARQQLAENISVKLNEHQRSLQDLHASLDSTAANLESFKDSEVAARQQLAESIFVKLNEYQQSLQDLHASLDSTSANLESFKDSEVAARQQLAESIFVKLNEYQQSLQDLHASLDSTSANLESFKDSEVAARQKLAEEVDAKYEEQQQQIATLQGQLEEVDSTLRKIGNEISAYQELMEKRYVKNKRFAIAISLIIGSMSITGILLSILL